MTVISPSRRWRPRSATPRTALPAARRRRSARRCGAAARAAGWRATMPLAFEMPMPSEPVLVTMPGVPTSGWPGRPSSRRSWWSLSNGQRPEADQHRVEAGRVVALRREDRGRRPRHRREVAHAAASSRCRVEKLVPMWPDPARGDHVERVEPAQIGEQRRARAPRSRLETADAVELGSAARNRGVACDRLLPISSPITRPSL